MSMKRHYLFFAVIALLFCSCRKTPDPELGDEFQGMDGMIDMSQSNRFNEDNFCNTWALDKVIYEKYVDGELAESSDVSGRYSMPVYAFSNNHTMTSRHSGEVTSGTWLYSHNYLMMHIGSGYYSYEVSYSRKGVLHLREEWTPVGGIHRFKRFYEDPSGTHEFTTYELKPE